MAQTVVAMTWVYWALMIAYGVTIVTVVGIVVSENRNPVKSLAWITVLLALPALGLVLFFLFGRSIKNKRYISRRSRRRLKKHEPATAFKPSEHPWLSPQSCALIQLGQGLAGSPFYEGNSAEYFDNGRAKFESMKRDIAAARRFIYMQYYIIADDTIGNEIADLLIEKAREGVDVKVIYDSLGSFRTPRRFFRRMRKAGVDVYPFFKVRFPLMGSRINWRNHRKITIIDGTTGYIGGMNIADRYIDGGKPGAWHDAHLRVKGPILRSLLHSFSADWNAMGRPLPEGIAVTEPEPQEQNLAMQLITSGPVGQWSNVAMEFQKAIGSARNSVWLQTPYFLPNEGLLKALQTAALSKIDVRVMMPKKSDTALFGHASFSFVKECLQAGIKVYLFEDGMLHSKMLIVDDQLVSIGSANFDFRSFEHNFESNLFIYSKEFNESMRHEYLAAQEKSERVLPYGWSHRRRRDKIMESLTRLFSPIL